MDIGRRNYAEIIGDSFNSFTFRFIKIFIEKEGSVSSRGFPRTLKEKRAL